MTQHTPGPWVIQQEFDNKPSYIVAEKTLGRSVSKGVDVARLEPGRETIANARLIAAAPEMFDALGELADAVADDAELKRLTAAMAKAGAVLAKVEGDNEFVWEPVWREPGAE